MINAPAGVQMMSNSNINMLSKMADMKRAAHGAALHQPHNAQKPSFVQVLNGINQSQSHAATLSKKFISGDPSVNLSEVLSANQSAKIEMETLRVARNKLVEISKDILNTQI